MMTTEEPQLADRLAEAGSPQQALAGRGAELVVTPQARRARWLPASSKLAGSSQRSQARRRAGHSPSRIEYQAVSRFSPFTTMCWRNTPSKVKPKRRAARFEGSFLSLHFHSKRR